MAAMAKRVLRALAGAVLAIMAAPALAATCPAAPVLRAMTYNIRLNTPADANDRWDTRRDALFGQIDLVRPDILGLQEVLPGQLRDAEAALPGYVRIGGGRDGTGENGGDRGEASPLFVLRAAFTVAGGGMIWLSPTPDRPSRGWDGAYPRVATWAHLRRRGSGERVLAINTHWDHEGRQARLESAWLLRRWIAANRQAGERVVLMGDFNAGLDEDSLRALTAPADGPALADSRAAAGRRAFGPMGTFNGFDPARGDGPAIDHVLAGSGLVALRHTVLQQAFAGHAASDHWPVIADLALVPARPRRGC